MLESVLAICLFAITMLILVERLFRKNSAQDKEIQAIRREIDELRTNLYCAQIDCIKRDKQQADLIEAALRIASRETEGE
jgi:hypothetical protein